jgi:excisionase family DNA binding protein
MPDEREGDYYTYTVAEGACILRLSTQAVRDAIRHGDLRGHKHAGRYLIPKAALHAYME